MTEVDIVLVRPSTNSHLNFKMKVRTKNVDRIPQFIEFRYPGWELVKLVRLN